MVIRIKFNNLTKTIINNRLKAISNNRNIKNYRTSAKKDLIVSKELNEVIIGCMLGDLTAEKPNERSNTRLQFKQSIKNKPYINHL